MKQAKRRLPICTIIGLGLLVFIVGSCTQHERGYFVDATLGDDNNSGTSRNKPWKTAEKVSSILFEPGDKIFFKRGTHYTNGVQINGHGTADKPIIVSAYGEGDAPKFTNTNDTLLNGNAVQMNGSYQIVENLYVYGINTSKGGDFLSVWKIGGIMANMGADHAIIRNNEVEDCPIGINSYSNYALITNNYIHDCNRALHHPNWGPLGIRIGMGNTEISYNTINNYHSMGGHWGGDGGAIEIDDGRNPRNNVYIHHNKTSHCMGFCEISYGFDICNPRNSKHLEKACKQGDCRTCTTKDRIYDNIIIAYNESRDYRTFTQIWGPLSNSFIENNTIIRTLEHPDIESNVFCEFDPDTLAANSPTTYRNNLVVVVTETTRMGRGNQVYLGYPMAQFTHEGNLFYNLNDSAVTLSDSAEMHEKYAVGEIFADPKLTNIEAGDYRLLSESPAIDKGLNEGHYDTDLDGNPIIGVRDIGAYEYQKP